MTSLRFPPGQRHREREALGVGDDVAPAARPCAADRAGAPCKPRRAAWTWEELITARNQSGFFRSTRCNASHTPASFHAARWASSSCLSRNSVPAAGTPIGWMPVCRKNRIPHSVCRSGTRGRPSTGFGPGAWAATAQRATAVRPRRSRAATPSASGSAPWWRGSTRLRGTPSSTKGWPGQLMSSILPAEIVEEKHTAGIRSRIPKTGCGGTCRSRSRGRRAAGPDAEYCVGPGA